MLDPHVVRSLSCSFVTVWRGMTGGFMNPFSISLVSSGENCGEDADAVDGDVDMSGEVPGPTVSIGAGAASGTVPWSPVTADASPPPSSLPDFNAEGLKQPEKQTMRI